MKVSYQESVTKEQEVPDYFAYDESTRGCIVDVVTGYSSLRDDLYSKDKRTVLRAIEELTEAYKKADKILALKSLTVKEEF